MPVYPDGYREFAYVANSTGNTISVLDLVYLREDHTLSVGADPVALAVNPKLDEVYAVSAQSHEAIGSLSVIDTQQNEVVATIPLHRGPAAIAIDPTGRQAYVTNAASNTVSLVDLPSRHVLFSTLTGDHPGGVAVAPDGRSLVVTNLASGSVSLYSVAEGERSVATSSDPASRVARPASLTLRRTFVGCPGASSPVILPDSSKVFVACSSGHQVMAIGLAAAPDSWMENGIVKGMTAPAAKAPLASDHLLALLDVGQQPVGLTMKPDGGEIFASNLASDSVSEILTSTNEVGSTYPIGNRPKHGVVSADNGALWISASGADSISLYSIDDGQFLSSLRTGSGPDALAFSHDQHLLLAADVRSGDVAIIRTASKLGPALLTILPAGGGPSAIVVKAMPAKR